jgi:hypothetical protein
VQVINGGKEHYMYTLEAYATVDAYTETSGMVSFIINDCQSKVPESEARQPDTVWSVSYEYSYSRTNNTASITNLTVRKVTGGGSSVGFISLRGDMTNTSAATFTVRNAAETHAIVKEIYDNFNSDNFSAIKNNMVRTYTDYEVGFGTTSYVGVYDLEIGDVGVNALTIAFKFSLPSDAATALRNCIFYVTCKITIGTADDGSGDTYTFKTFKVSGTAM